MNTRNPSNIINLAEFIRDNFDGLTLAKYIYENTGGSSKHLLSTILQPKSKIEALQTVAIENVIQEYGPILVSEFQVYQDFLEENRFLYHGDSEDSEEGSVGMHSMLIIGYRKENDKVYYLLQNFWEKKQFIEVDGVYLKKCGATLYYVETSQNKIQIGRASCRERV